MKQRIACLWLPHWLLERCRRAQPALRDSELVLYEEYHRGCFRVVDYSGKQAIQPGMPLAQTRAISLERCERHDPVADEAELVYLAGWCEWFSPLVGIEPPDNLILDVTGVASLFGGEKSLVRQIRLAFQRQRLICRIAVADTIGAAWAVAHHGCESPAIVPARKTTPSLSALPVSALRLPIETVGILLELGVERIGQLIAETSSERRRQISVPGSGEQRSLKAICSHI